MIRFAIEPDIQSLIDYLNEHYPTERDAIAVVLPGYDSVAVVSKFADEYEVKTGWACYDPETCVLWIPGELPQIDGVTEGEARLIHYETIAHEFIHHLQNCEGREFDEDEADMRAVEILDDWFRSHRKSSEQSVYDGE